MRLFILLAFIMSSAWSADDKVSLIFADVRLVDLVRVAYGELSREPYMLTPDVAESRELFSVDLRSVDRSRAMGAVRQLAQGAGFDIQKRNGVIWIGKVKDEEEEIIVYRPRHRSARYLADVVQSVTGARSLMARSIKNGQGAERVESTKEPQTVTKKTSSPTSVEGQIDRSEVDQIAFSIVPKEVGKIRKLLNELDTSPGDVLLKAAVYEVGTDRREGGAVKLVASLLGGKLGLSLGTLSDGVTLKLAAGGIEAVLQALDADTRFKSVSRPQVRVRNGSSARFSVGQDVPVLGNAQFDKNGNPVQSVDYKQSGVILTAIPEIRDNVIELSLQQELSNFVVTKTGVNNSPTLIKRAVNTHLGIQPGEVVVIAGMQDEQADEAENRLPFIGWLFNQQKQQRQSEVLLFIEAQRI